MGKRQAEQRLLQEQGTGREAKYGRSVKGLQIPGLHVFALAPQNYRSKAGDIPLTSLVQAVRSSSFSNEASSPLGSARLSKPIHLIQSWCRSFEQTISEIGLGIIEEGNQSDLSTSGKVSDPVLLEEGLISVLDIRNPYSLPVDHLLNLVYYNVFRGLARNIRALNLDMQLMVSKDHPSPFITGQVDISTLAPDFHPTLIQRTVPHHPCLDVFPDPVVRDNSIQHWANELLEMEGRLCMQIAGRHTWHEIDIPSRHGLVLWGEPDVVESWEVTEGFARDWPGLVKGAFRLQAATNAWRAQRDEPPIFFA